MPSLRRHSEGCPLEILEEATVYTVAGERRLNDMVLDALAIAAGFMEDTRCGDMVVHDSARACVEKIKNDQCPLYKLTPKGFLFKKSK